MAVADEAEGWAEAQRRIAVCRETQADTLDLGGLRLTRVPEELYELGWLRRLYLGADAEGREQPDFGFGLEDKKRCNALDTLPGALCEALVRLELLDLAHNSLQVLPAELAGLVKLTSLVLGDNQIGVRGAQALAALVNLTSLDLSWGKIDADGARALAGLVNLTSLDLAGNRIGADGALALARLVNLTSLNLGFNQIGADGTRALAGLVKLTSLNLGFNQIGADGTRALTELVNLTSLDLGSNWIGANGASALARLVKLTSLDLGSNHIGADGALALAGLVNLTSLDLVGNDIGDDGARALANLIDLTSLRLRYNKIGADGARGLAGLVNLTLLDLGNNHIGADGARALAVLVNLTSLDLGDNDIGVDGARALATLVNLTSLNLGENEIGDDGARAFSGLVRLTSLYVSHNKIGGNGVRAFSSLVNLTSLSLGGNEIGADGARPLGALVNLTSLGLSSTGVKDLSPLLKLGKLRELNCSGCQLDDAIPALWMMPSLSEAILHDATLPGVPAEVLSPSPITSCLETLRAHFNDLAAGEAEMADVKFMILGNGRVGKTQLCRRLRGERYDDTVPSTHGIEISSAPLARAPGGAPLATLRIWDFGGQDIYHGTHALFLKSRAIFPLVWTPQSEVTQFHDHGGFTFRNQPLGYWLAYVRSLGGRDSPVLVIQAQCDRPEDERASLPLPPGALDAFPFQKPLRFSAKTDRGRAALDEALADAVTWLRRNQGVDKIGKGRAEVKAGLEAMRDDDAGRPPAERRHRLVTQAEFLSLCEKAGNISSPDALLDYLHNCGTVFYRRGLFGDRIILDQAWALDAVYAVFDRKRSYRNLQRYRGRFTRSDLGQWIWDAEGYAPEEQELFLSLMQQCGICFQLRWGDRAKGIKAEYIAPDLLPGREDPEIASELQQKWDERCDAHATLTYELLPPGLMRALISRIGGEAGLAAEYWRNGFYFYDQTTRSKALVEQRWTEGWAGEIRIETQRGQAQVLLDRLLRLIDDRNESFGARAAARIRSTREAPSETIGDNRRKIPSFDFKSERAPGPVRYVSYAWGDDTVEGRDRVAVVDRLCAAAKAKGIAILRDAADMKTGDSITKFMKDLGAGDRVFIVLSDKYLRSAYCMFELYEVWRNCRLDTEQLRQRTRVYVLPSAGLNSAPALGALIDFWRSENKRIADLLTADPDKVKPKELSDYLMMRKFIPHISTIIGHFEDILRARTVEEFIEHALEDLE